MGRGFVKVGAEKPDPEDVRMVEEAWSEAERALQSGEWDLVVLDEINYAISYGMLEPARVVQALKSKPAQVHVILTGRNAHPTIVEIADTVTEMRQVKHAYGKGVMAQRGIEYYLFGLRDFGIANYEAGVPQPLRTTIRKSLKSPMC